MYTRSLVIEELEYLMADLGRQEKATIERAHRSAMVRPYYDEETFDIHHEVDSNGKPVLQDILIARANALLAMSMLLASERDG